MLSLYLIVLGLVSILAIVTMTKNDTDKVLYYVSLGIMTLLLGFRFGQGIDYPGYMYIYEMARNVFNPEKGFFAYIYYVHSEFGWQCLMTLFKIFDVDFWVISMITAVIMMYCSHLGIVYFCKKYRTVALLLLYPTIYLTYYFSAMRQGVAMAIFFGVLLPKVLEKNIKKYVLGILLLSTIHTASLVYLIVPIILLMKKRIFVFGTILSVFFSAALFVEPIGALIKNVAMLLGASSGYFGNPSISWFSLVERLVMVGLIAVLFYQNKTGAVKKDVTPLLKIYFTGFLIYILLMSNSFVSSRLAIMFKMLEIVIIPMLLNECYPKIRNIVFVVLLGITVVMSYKNLDYYAEGYKEGITGYNYPYVSIFNREDILKYREEYINEWGPFRESDYF